MRTCLFLVFCLFVLFVFVCLYVEIHNVAEKESENNGVDRNAEISGASSGCVRNVSENISE